MKTASRVSITVVMVLLAVIVLAAPSRANPGIKTSSTTSTSPTSSVTSTTDKSSTSSTSSTLPTSSTSSTSSTTLPPLKPTSAPKIYRLHAVPNFKDKNVSYSTVENNGVECWDRSLKSLRASNALSKWLRNPKSTVTTAPSPLGLPTFPGATAYCVTVEEKRPERLNKGFTHRGLIYSLYSEETHTPVAVFFRFPMAVGSTSRPPVGWPSSVAPQPEAWKLDTVAYKAGTTPGSFVLDAELEEWQLPETRGHMVASGYFDGDNDFQAATFNFANAFPSFNRPFGNNSKPIISWDGVIWGGREKALQAYATASGRGLEQLFVVVGTSQTNPQMYIPLTSAMSKIDNVAGPTRDQLADVPQYAWTAVYDSVSKTALAWDCLVRVDNIVTDPKKDIASCNYVSVDDIAQKYNVDPFPGIDDEARKNKYPSKFIKPAADANPTAFAAKAKPPPPDWLVTEKVEPVTPTSSTPKNVLSPSTSAPTVTLVNKLTKSGKGPSLKEYFA